MRASRRSGRPSASRRLAASSTSFQNTEATGRVDEAPGAAATSITSSEGMRPLAATTPSGRVAVHSPRDTTSKPASLPPRLLRRIAERSLASGASAVRTPA